ncbi:Trypanosome variant surface glycoprotein C-terminal domain containing protein, putative [Trypanosoma equiperdum]|uniref:Trypanosome variant surface glycoprotein C-terminal domain containing protein, putative n=1 Tax=Trypanosoma equiperdum TaxID=5694 RepID=A0A1G4I0N6_TRYEQ|nr:Trypanosome variant surface glycoprotein C-terminal domain containing protein, putative [Trypanosoma equiperdum]
MSVFALASADTADDTLAFEATSWCHERAFVASIVEAIDAEEAERLQTLKQDAELLTLWTIAKESESSAVKRGEFAALLSYAIPNAAANIDAAISFAAAARLAKKFLQARISLFDQAEAIIRHAPTYTGQGAQSGGQAGSSDCTVTAALAAGTDMTCNTDDLTKLSTAETRKLLATATGIKFVTATTAIDLVTPGAAKLRGQGSNNYDGQVGGGCSCGTHCGTQMKIQKHEPHTARGAGAGQSVTKFPESDAEKPAATDKAADPETRTATKIAALLKGLQGAINRRQKPLQKLKLSDITNSPDAAQIARDLLDLQGKNTKVADTDSATALKALLKEKLGPEEADFQRKFLTEFKNTPIKYKKGDTEDATEISKTTNNGLTTPALSDKQGASLRRLLEKSKVTSTQSTSADCTRKHKKSDCKDGDGCKWTSDSEETGNHCKPKNEEGQTNTTIGAGTGTGATTVKCSDYGNQQECEKANDGIPAGQPRKCGWIGEDKSGGDKGFKCRDSSFLLNKKLALMAASFGKSVGILRIS